MMKIKLKTKLLLWVFPLLIIGNPLLAQTTGEDENIFSNLKLHIYPGNLIKSDSDRKVADYISGMPVVLGLRLVNISEKNNSKNVADVHMPDDWRDDVNFVLKDSLGNSVMDIVYKDIGKKRTKEEMEKYFSAISEVDCKWEISGEFTKELDGEYSLLVDWKVDYEIILNFHQPKTDEDRARLLVALAENKMRNSEYIEAVTLLEKVKSNYSEFYEENSWVSVPEVMADALAGAGHYQEALEIYERKLAEYNEKYDVEGARFEPPVVYYFKINKLKANLKNTQSVGAEVPSDHQDKK
jgi:hypothetical protein